MGQGPLLLPKILKSVTFSSFFVSLQPKNESPYLSCSVSSIWCMQLYWHMSAHAPPVWCMQKQHAPLLFMTLFVWDIGMKKMKERAKTSDLLVDYFSLTFVNLLLTWMLQFHGWLQNKGKTPSLVGILYSVWHILTFLVIPLRTTVKQLK